jgi:hypothetical protein
MPLSDMFKPKKSVDELEEEDKEEELRLSIAQKKALQEKLKANGLNAGMFGSVSKAWNWFKTH